MMAPLVALLEAASCFGLGAVLLQIFRINPYLRADERLMWSFGLGFGGLGWLVFFVGLSGGLTPTILTFVLAVSAAGVGLIFSDLRTTINKLSDWSTSPVERLLLLGFAIVTGFDILEGIAPPADADTLAYHFTLPKIFLEAARLVFVPRAVDGASPMLVQMTYLPALGLGGELGLTLWTMISGWAAGGLLFTSCRCHLGTTWSLAVTLVFLSVPAVIFGGGTGQVEIRVAFFTMIAATGISLALKTGLLRFAAVAGLAIGFFIGAKYTGLLFAVACGLVILFQRRWLAHSAALTAVAIIVGCQWYLWNAWYTGDPVFPMLYTWLHDVVDYRFWDQTHADYLQSRFFKSELELPLTPLGFIYYPIQATFGNLPGDGSGRTGFGIFAALIAPYAVLGVWLKGSRVLDSELFPAAMIVFLFFILWYFTGSSQRIRHLLPVFPILIISLSTAAKRAVSRLNLYRPVTAVFAVCLLIQLAGFGLYSQNYLLRLVRGESRQTFLEQNVAGTSSVPWINLNLTSRDHLFVETRQILYLLQVSTFFGHPINQTLIDLAPKTASLEKFKRQLKGLGITHALTPGGVPVSKAFFNALINQGCARPIKQFESKSIRSRTLARAGVDKPNRLIFKVLEFNWNACDKPQAWPILPSTLGK